jgi:methanogenic corrinoid protein MtbC1
MAARALGVHAGRTLSGPRLVSDNSGEERQLSRVVELEIIPRLLMLHAGATAALRGDDAIPQVSGEHVHTLAELAAEGDADAAKGYVHALSESGLPHDCLLLDLLAPCVRLLGQRWEDDTYTFSQVTVAMWRLQSALHDHREPVVPFTPPVRRAVFTALPGAQHTFGTALAAQFFRAHGWEVFHEPGLDLPALCARSSAPVQLIGVSISTDSEIEQSVSAILALRRAYHRHRTVFLVSGPMAGLYPDLAERCGADVGAASAVEALLVAHQLVADRHPKTESMVVTPSTPS